MRKTFGERKKRKEEGKELFDLLFSFFVKYKKDRQRKERNGRMSFLKKNEGRL